MKQEGESLRSGKTTLSDELVQWRKTSVKMREYEGFSWAEVLDKVGPWTKRARLVIPKRVALSAH